MSLRGPGKIVRPHRATLGALPVDIGIEDWRRRIVDDAQDFTPHDLRLMQGLAQRVAAVRPELVNDDATLGELAWVWGKDHSTLGDTWRRRLWYRRDELVGWGWIYLPHRVAYSDGSVSNASKAYLSWQIHPDRPDVLDEILDWYDGEARGADHRTTVRAADTDALNRLAAHGYLIDAGNAADDGYWVQVNARDLTDVEEPTLPPGFRFRTADEVGPEAAVRAHVDAWHPSSFTELGFEGVRRTWPYRPDLHVLLEAPDGALVSTAVIWLDGHNRTAEFEPVGTHRGYRRRGLGRSLLLHGMHRAREAGATRMIVTSLGGAAHPAARGLYYSAGFEPFTRAVPHIRPAG